MIERFIEEKLFYRKGKNIFVNQTNVSDFLQNSEIAHDIKLQLLEHIRIIEDYNAINILFKNFDIYSKDIQNCIINSISMIPFSKIEQIIIRLVNHRDISIRITVLKALRNLKNFELLEIIYPQISGGNTLVRINALNTYHCILTGFITSEYSLHLSSEDEDIKKETFLNLKNISDTNSELEELKNITYFDKDLEEIQEVQKDHALPLSVNHDYLSKHLEKIEKSSNYNFVSIMSLTIILLITIMYSFFAERSATLPNENSIFSPKRKLSFSPDTLLSREAFKKAFEELENGNLDKAESYFEKINDTNTKNYYLFKINMKKNNFQKAALYFLSLSEYSADNIKEYIQLVNEIKKSGETNLSIEIGEKLIYFNSHEINNILLELYSEHDIEKALLFNRFYNINNYGLLKKAAEYYSEKDPAKSLEYFEKLILLGKTPDEKIGFILKADNLLSKHPDMKKKRIEFIKINYNRFPQNTDLMKKIAQVYLEEEEYKKASEILSQLITRDTILFNDFIFDHIRTLYILDRKKGFDEYKRLKEKINNSDQKKIEVFLK